MVHVLCIQLQVFLRGIFVLVENSYRHDWSLHVEVTYSERS